MTEQRSDERVEAIRERWNATLEAQGEYSPRDEYTLWDFVHDDVPVLFDVIAQYRSALEGLATHAENIWLLKSGQAKDASGEAVLATWLRLTEAVETARAALTAATDKEPSDDNTHRNGS